MLFAICKSFALNKSFRFKLKQGHRQFVGLVMPLQKGIIVLS